MNDQQYMRMALQLAEKGCGFVAPNPMVGAVIVKDGRIIGQGWHERYRGSHAERNALASCTESPRGADMYVTLEPCCHHGKQPPCVDAILEAGIRRVVIGSTDPNPLVSGKGIQILRENGVEVTENILQKECSALNEVFFHYIRTGRPFVVMKYAMTLDGKIAAYTGVSKWITGEAARNHVHQQRHRFTAIMTGVGTVLADDPLLTCRMEGGRNPLDHYGADAAKQHAGQDAIRGESFQVSGALGDDLPVAGKDRGQRAASPEACPKDDYAHSAASGHGSEKSFPRPLL